MKTWKQIDTVWLWPEFIIGVIVGFLIGRFL